MNFFLILSIQIITIAIESYIFARALSFSFYGFLKKFNINDEKQKKRAIQWLIYRPE